MLDDLNYAYGGPCATGLIKQQPQDFCVEEELGFELSGEGEHLFLNMQKTLLTTEELAKIIAKTLSVPVRAVSYAGLKDKFARTSQWFSVHLPGKETPDLGSLNAENYCLLDSKRHLKKLKTGVLKKNHFTVTVSQFDYDKTHIEQRIAKIKAHGVPNYFGPQRFGNNGSNLEHAKELLLNNKKVKNRYLRGIYFSAARALLFNHIVNQRIIAGNWNTPVNGDLMMLAGTKSVFLAEVIDDEIKSRVEQHDIFPAACLWGEGKERLIDEALALQQQALAPWSDWCDALEKNRLERAYRSMVLLPENLRLEDNTFRFSLPKGAFATTVLRELLDATP